LLAGMQAAMQANDMAEAANIYANGKNARRNATTMRTLREFAVRDLTAAGLGSMWSIGNTFHNNDGLYLDKLLG
jgi:hypothetical protein